MSVTQTPIAPGHWLAPAAAASYQRMRAAGLPAGGITDAGRTHAEQTAIFLARYTPRTAGSGPYGDVATWRGVRYVRTSGPSSAAPPGESKHETGRALDLQPAQEAWVRAHPDHGWRFTIASERWHAEYDLGRDQHLTPDAPVLTAPRPAPPEEPMIAIIKTPTSSVALIQVTADRTIAVPLGAQDTSTGIPVLDLQWEQSADNALRQLGLRK